MSICEEYANNNQNLIYNALEIVLQTAKKQKLMNSMAPDHVFAPFDLANHLGKFVANELMRNQRLAKRFALHGICDRLFIAITRLTSGASGN